MPIPSINGVNYQVRIKWLLHGQDCFNVLNFKGQGSVYLLEDLVQPILNCIVENLLPVLSNEITLLGADVRAITGSVMQEGEITLDDDNVGEEAVNRGCAVARLRGLGVGGTARPRNPETSQPHLAGAGALAVNSLYNISS